MSDVSSFPSVLDSVLFIESLHTNVETQTGQHVDNNVIDANDTLPHISPNHVTEIPTIQHNQPSNPATSPISKAINRPSRQHKLPTHLHDYILPKNLTKHLQNPNISLNTVFSKHQHVSPEVLALESQTLHMGKLL